ncbi:MAG: sugar phosphate isomerase/epimerase family protein [Candidatus Latescibacterota bacterium]
MQVERTSLIKSGFMTFSTPHLSLPEVLEYAGRYGYNGIEPRLDEGHAHGIEVAATSEQRAAIKQRVADSGIALACLATSLKYADPDRTETMIRQTHERIDLAGDVGAPAMRVFGGQIPEGINREQAIDLLAESLGAVAGHADDRGVTLCLETHDDWCDPTHVAEVVAGVNHPAIAVNWDIMHPVRTGNATIDESFIVLKPWIRHLHVHDGDDSGLLPIGEGIVDHRRAIALLKTISFDGFLSGEWIDWESYAIHLPRELQTLKRYEQEVS